MRTLGPAPSATVPPTRPHGTAPGRGARGGGARRDEAPAPAPRPSVEEGMDHG